MGRVLVTGAAGFIGLNFVHQAIDENWYDEITALDSLTYAANLGAWTRLSNTMRCIEADIANVEKYASLLSSVDLVINFAAETHNDRSLLDPRGFLTTNVLGLGALAQACAAAEVHLHQVSTDEVYGDVAVDSAYEFSEEDALRPSSPYSASKAAGDLLLAAYERSFGLSYTISRSGNNYGPHQNEEKFIPQIIKSIQIGEAPRVFGDGLNVREWVHVKAHSEAINLIAKREHSGEIFNVGSSIRISNNELVSQISQMMTGQTVAPKFVPDRLGHDRKYAVSSKKLRARFPAWNPSEESFENLLSQTIAHYSSASDG